MRAAAFHLSRAVGTLLAVLLTALVALATVEAGAWALFGISWAETSEIAGVLLIWFGLLGAVYGIHTRTHLGLELLTSRLPARPRAVIGRLAALMVATFGVLLSYHGARLTAQVTNTLPATGLSASVQYFPAIVCGALIAFFALLEATLGVADSTAEDDAGDD